MRVRDEGLKKKKKKGNRGFVVFGGVREFVMAQRYLQAEGGEVQIG